MASWLPLLHDLADRADAIALRYFLSPDLRIDRKPDHSWVTQADLDVESAVRDRLARVEPNLGVFGEEHGEDRRGAPCRLIVDPIDATANFARGIPVFATLLAIEDAGEIVAGVVSAPALGRRWHAARGEGAWCGGRRLRVSDASRLSEAQVFHAGLFGTDAGSVEGPMTTLLQHTWRQRGFGDFWQHALVAEGAGELALDPVVAPWDVAALQVLVEEAGGRASSMSGERTIYGGSLISSNGHLHAEALAALAAPGQP